MYIFSVQLHNLIIKILVTVGWRIANMRLIDVQGVARPSIQRAACLYFGPVGYLKKFIIYFDCSAIVCFALSKHVQFKTNSNTSQMAFVSMLNCKLQLLDSTEQQKRNDLSLQCVLLRVHCTSCAFNPGETTDTKNKWCVENEAHTFLLFPAML